MLKGHWQNHVIYWVVCVSLYRIELIITVSIDTMMTHDAFSWFDGLRAANSSDKKTSHNSSSREVPTSSIRTILLISTVAWILHTPGTIYWNWVLAVAKNAAWGHLPLDGPYSLQCPRNGRKAANWWAKWRCYLNYMEQNWWRKERRMHYPICCSEDSSCDRLLVYTLLFWLCSKLKIFKLLLPSSYLWRRVELSTPPPVWFLGYWLRLAALVQLAWFRVIPRCSDLYCLDNIVLLIIEFFPLRPLYTSGTNVYSSFFYLIYHLRSVIF
jgi:hypothetical protein